ncbi:thermonuclease family protein [Aggregatibacter actinomycetemcomitans]|uniref:thermonuclease family protein n=1 Tax=Aggregatibacter actinomycetemcomitans TaxID=714 RepID=UPI001E5A69A6|nr:thermonuclease family protein [Aggregatibacter actinomycetemcomitans]
MTALLAPLSIMRQGFFCILLVLLPFTVHAHTLACRVVGISDGDSFTCLTGNHKQIKVRLAEIDAPEHNQPFGKKSRQMLASLIHQREIKLEISGEDRYHRKLAIAYDAQGQNVNLIMVQQGMAWAYKQYVQDPVYREAEQRAKKRCIGLWQDRHPIEPHLWRQQRR